MHPITALNYQFNLVNAQNYIINLTHWFFICIIFNYTFTKWENIGVLIFCTVAAKEFVAFTKLLDWFNKTFVNTVALVLSWSALCAAAAYIIIYYASFLDILCLIVSSYGWESFGRPNCIDSDWTVSVLNISSAVMLKRMIEFTIMDPSLIQIWTAVAMRHPLCGIVMWSCGIPIFAQFSLYTIYSVYTVLNRQHKHPLPDYHLIKQNIMEEIRTHSKNKIIDYGDIKLIHHC